MRYLVISDIHGNLEAFQAGLEMARGKYDSVLCLGDIVGYGPDPNAAIDLLRQTGATVIRGNHDRACSGASLPGGFNSVAESALLWTHRQLTPENLGYLRQLPRGPLKVAGIEIVHGSPGDEDRYIFDAADAIPLLRDQKEQVVLFGHTHHQGGFELSPRGLFKAFISHARRNGRVLTFEIRPRARYLINPGSIGQPRDRDWRAAFAVLDDGKQQVEYYRCPYNLELTQNKMRQAGLPPFLIDRLSVGR